MEVNALVTNNAMEKELAVLKDCVKVLQDQQKTQAISTMKV
jgi:hypothetical protein